MRYLLDTNACIQVLNGTSPELVARLRAHASGEIGLSAVVRAELLCGARKSQRAEQNLKLLAAFFEPFPSVAFDDRCAEQYGAIRARLESVGQPIGPNDLLIAATALAHDLMLVTHNAREFSRVAGLRLEDWED